MISLEEPVDVLEPGVRVDHFRVVRMLGRGGAGEVYLARDTKLGRKVALKVIRSETLEDRQARLRFIHEARVTARFNHPHIVTIFAVGEHASTPYVALEYLEGENLAQRLQSERPGVRQALRIALAVAEALEEAHAQGVFHRDLKPQNILIPRDGRVRVVDFGLAKRVEEVTETGSEPPPTDQAEGAGCTRSGTGGAALQEADTLCLGELETHILQPESRVGGIRGTPAYMAPEQWEAKEVGPAADIWALGIILHELLTGVHPYTKDGFRGLRSRVTSDEPAPQLEDPNGEVEDEIKDLVARCLSKRPEERPSANELVRALGGWLNPSALGDDESPYRGLLPFGERHAHLFYGREREVGVFLERLRDETIIPVVGPSGAGKSSFVAAGVVPRLREQGGWTMIRIRPGGDPFRVLAAKLAVYGSNVGKSGPVPSNEAAGGERGAEYVSKIAADLRQAPDRLGLELESLAKSAGGKVLLFVDQMEELFTLVEDEETRVRFLRAVVAAADDVDGASRVVLTLRDDFLWRLAESRRLLERLGGVMVLSRLGARELRRVVELPLRAKGYRFDDSSLPDSMAEAVEDEVAALPLLQFAAQRLWESRDESARVLSKVAYQEMGGVEGALVGQVESILSGMTPQETDLARRVLVRLVTSQGTRRIVAERDLLEEVGERAGPVVEKLVKGRAVIASKGEEHASLELIHESLVTSWPRLSRWLEESREDRVFLDEAGRAASLWDQRGRPSAEVWAGPALHEALRRLEAVESAPTLVREFLAAGKREHDRRARRRKALLAGGAVFLLLVALTATGVAWYVNRQKEAAQAQRDRARRSRFRAERQRAAALLESARAAVAKNARLEARAKLRESMERRDSRTGRALWTQLRTHAELWRSDLGSIGYDVDFSPDGGRVAVACQDKSVRIFDVATRRQEVLRGHTDQVFSLAFDPKGERLVTGTWGGRVNLWDVDRRRRKLLGRHRGGVWAVACSPDGGLVATGADDGTLALWDMESERLLWKTKAHEDTIYGLSFGPRGERVATASYDFTAAVWDVGSRRKIAQTSRAGSKLKDVWLSRDSRYLVTTGAGGIRKWRVEGGGLEQELLGHSRSVTAIGASPGGDLIVTAGDDGLVKLWHTSTFEQIGVLGRHEAQVRDVAVSPDGRYVASTGTDHTVRLWKMENVHALDVSGGHEAPLRSVAFDPSGRSILTSSVDRTVRGWDVERGSNEFTYRGHRARVRAMAVSPDGGWGASGSFDGRVVVWRYSKGGLVETKKARGHRGSVLSISIGPGGLMFTGGSDAASRLWKVYETTPGKGFERSPLRVELLRAFEGHDGSVLGSDFSKDGKLLATSSTDKKIKLWDVASGRLRQVFEGHTATVLSVSFSPTQRLIASASDDKTVRLWSYDAGDGAAREAKGAASRGGVRTLSGSHGRYYSVDFSPDGEKLAAACSDGMVRLWNLKSGERRAFRGHLDEVNVVRFDRTGRLVASTGDDHTVRLWDVDSGRSVWRTVVMDEELGALLTHRGWKRFGSVSAGSVASFPDGALDGWRQRARAHASKASYHPKSGRVCLLDGEGRLEVGRSRSTYTKSASRSLNTIVGRVDDVIARTEGCVVSGTGGVFLMDGENAPRVLGPPGGVVGSCFRGRLLVWASGRLTVFDEELEPASVVKTGPGVSAVGCAAGSYLLGYQEGGLDLLDGRSGRQRGLSFHGLPSSSVVRIVAGPPGTVAVGFSNGQAGVWSIDDGARLHHLKIHGSARHLSVRNEGLHVASDLGQYSFLDLKDHYRRRCEVLRSIWQRVPVIWQKGEAHREEPPKHHECAPPAGGKTSKGGQSP